MKNEQPRRSRLRPVREAPPLPVIRTHAEGLAEAKPLRERLRIQYPFLHPDHVKMLAAVSRGKSRTVVSGSKRIVFYVHRRGPRVTAKVFPVERQPELELLANRLNATYNCRRCAKAFAKRGKRIFCSPGCAADHKRLRRSGQFWTVDNLRPGAKARQAVADDVLKQKEARLQKAARGEQARLWRNGKPV